MVEILLDSAVATERLGARLAEALKPGCIIYLHGELGAGKTTLARGLLATDLLPWLRQGVNP